MQKPVIHVVLFRWKDGMPQETIDEIARLLHRLPECVPGLQWLTFGANFSERSRGYTHALASRMDDRNALRAYLEHPDHQDVAQRLILPNVADILACDWEA